ncbi:hypothetical protein [Halosolutus halophilus]|uniref:hypothetical protein n=1 Tax=Halosolutus halophilus TaxID=1552990 RepID=UPI00223502E8|nr:hypothetical protein [Halosolutus halophilus]
MLTRNPPHRPFEGARFDSGTSGSYRVANAQQLDRKALVVESATFAVATIGE